ncbi:MAG: tRNA 2-thiouridine(34) synthase MnmA [Bacteroidales bacterium]|nr:tRNA 2-thiouridine(34) synthase MnmA [Bacteroidales bacterium]
MDVALLVSGGVDSSVACYLMVQRGYKPHLFYIAIGPDKGIKEFDCKMEEDVEMCRWIAKKFQLPFEIVSLHDEYWEMIMHYHLESLKMGKTPNPDVLCNQLIKFGIFVEKYGKNYSLVATGHYAHIQRWQGVGYLHTAKDKIKDQTYFLSSLSLEQLQHLHFPLAHITKEEVRALAKDLGFPNANRKGSSGICFIARNQYTELIKSFLGTWEGEFVEYETGKKIGQHQGHWFYTIGQRKGLGLPGGPWFVVKKDAYQNVVYISRGYQPESIMKRIIYVRDIHPLFPVEINEHNYIHGFVKIRHTPNFSKAKVIKKGHYILIETEEPQQGVAPGQFAVMYDENRKFVLFSGEMIYPDT